MLLKLHLLAKFFFLDTGFMKDNRVIIFSTVKNLEIPNRCEVILSDGTFRTYPIGFTKLYIIQGIFLWQKYTFVFCLMEHKNEIS
jgi:hypothetical protein